MKKSELAVPGSRHRDDPICVKDAGLLGRLVRDRRQTEWVIIYFQPTLHDFDLDLVVRLVVHPHHAIERCLGKSIFFDIPEKVANRHGCLLEVEFQQDISQIGLDENAWVGG